MIRKESVDVALKKNRRGNTPEMRRVFVYSSFVSSTNLTLEVNVLNIFKYFMTKQFSVHISV